MKRTDKPVDTFIKKLTKLDHSLSNREKFRDFCELAYCAYAKLTAPTTERADELEARYMSIVNRYQNKDTIRAYPELLAIAQMAVEGGRCDFLGEVSGQLEVLDAYKGQFFTPYNVATMMAEMTLHDVKQIIDRDGYVTIQEPAAGAGGMILACADVIQATGFSPMTTMLVHAVDIAPLCYHMCYLQFTWRGVPAYVERGDTLRMESYEGAWTAHALPFQWHHGHISFTKPDIKQEPVISESPPDEKPHERVHQLTLF